MRRLVIALLLAAGCGDPPTSPPPPPARDLGIELFEGKWAVELRFVLGDASGDGGVLDADGGAQPEWSVLALLDATETGAALTDGGPPVPEVWQLCRLDLPGGLELPDDDAGLGRVFAPSTAQATSTLPGASLFQPPVAVIGGAQLAQPLTETLPSSAPLCGPQVPTPCLRPNPSTGRSGVRAIASGLTPDADEVDVDFRLAFSFHAMAHVKDGQLLDGTVRTAALEWHVVGCRLRAGGTCAAGDVAALEAARPAVTIRGDVVRAHLQSSGFGCAQLLADPELALTTHEPVGLAD